MRGFSIYVALVVLLCWQPIAHAQRDADEPIVFAGLRPSEDPSMKTTAIRRLAEAQTLRQVTENVLSAVSGRQVIGHDQLREMLGTGYLVDLVDCAGEPRCISSFIRPLGARGFHQVVVGDYYVDTAAHRYQFRITVYDVNGKRPPIKTSFELPEANIEDPKAWQTHLDALFSNRGTVQLVANIDAYQCTVDSKPCELGPDQALKLTAGEHVIELSKAGYLSRSRVVTVEAGKSVKVALGLDPLPLQAAQSPNRISEGIPKPGGVETKLFGRVEASVLIDNQNRGDTFDYGAAPDGSHTKEWNAAVLNNSSYVGISSPDVKAPKQFEARGLLLLGVFTGRRFRLVVSSVDLVRQDLGLKISVGRMYMPTVNTVEPGTLIDGNYFSSMTYTTTGARVSKTYGRLQLELGVGRPEVPLAADIRPAARAIPRVPYVESRIAFQNPDRPALLYGESTPMMLGVSGAFGLARLGVNEADAVQSIDPMAVTPKIEDAPSWIASAEAIVPFGHVVVSGEAYLGHGAVPYGGAVFQPARVNPMTGEHTQLKSFGAWAQISYSPSRAWEALVVGGFDWVYRGLDAGIPSDGGSSVEVNELEAAVITYRIRGRVRLGFEAHRLHTRYSDGSSGTVLGTILNTQLSF